MWTALIGAIRGLLTRHDAGTTRPPSEGESATQKVPLPTKADLRFTKVEDSLHSYRSVMAHQYFLEAEISWDFEYSQAIDSVPWDRPWGSMHPGYYQEWCIQLGLAWTLVEGLEVYAIPSYTWEYAYRRLQRAPVFVDWEYDVSDWGSAGAPVDKGFVPGRSSPSLLPEEAKQLDYYREQEENPHRQAALFRLHSYDDLVKVLASTVGDACGEVTVFGVSPGRGEKLVAFLRSPDRPSLDQFLEPGEVFVDLLFGHDLGYDDCVTVKSATNLDNSIRDLEQVYDAAIASFEQAAPGIQSESDSIVAVQRLASGSHS